MAESKCLNCGNTQFEVKVATPEGSNFKINFVQCNNCGGVVGALEFYDTGALILQLAEKLNHPLGS